MRALSVHSDLIVFISRFWQTTCTAVRAGDEGFVIDSPVYPEELRVLPGVLEQAGYPVSGLLTTHGDWDHLLGRLAFPGAALAAGESTVARLGSELGQAHRELREFDEEHYVAERAPLSLGSLQALPVPGRLEIGSSAAAGARELELHPTGGHTADGTAFWMPWCNALVCGDYLSPVELPAISPGGSAAVYQETLQRLAPLVAQAEWVVPGHGGPISGERAQQVLAEDRAYLEALMRDREHAALPEGRRTAAQRRLHADNVAQL
jgi:glyoxylase-like metal-dependent hydrolase (beta-lactamase superfamily II)